MNRVIFSTASRTRKPEYQLQTTALHGDSGIVFRKTILQPTAIKQLAQLKKSFTKLSKFEDETLHIADILNRESPLGTYLDFEHIIGNSLEKELLDAILTKNDSAQLEVVDTWLSVLDRFAIGGKSSKHKHSYDEKWFGPELFETFHGSPCIMPGLLDCNFDNVINEGERLSLIDYEWCFDHCLPRNYVIARALMWLGMRHANTLLVHANRISLVSLSDRIVLPKVIFDKYVSELVLNSAFSIEWKYFQSAITGLDLTQNLTQLIVDKNPSTPVFALDELESQRTKISNLESQVAETTQLYQNTNVELQAIKKKLAYRAARKIKHISRKLKP